ncbi:MAG: arginase [Bacteroidota bacterium]|nr:arginase [Bacteroidota bacterium]
MAQIGGFYYICRQPTLGGFVKNVKIITVESDFGAGTRGAKLGPRAFLKSINKLNPSLFENIPVEAVITSDLELIEEPESARNIDNIITIENRIINLVQKALEANEFPFIISGDHSNGLGGISGLKNYYPDKKIGVIWVDAHADLHSPYTSPSGNIHGMPLAAALGIGSKKDNKHFLTDELTEKWNQLITLGDHKISPKIMPENLVFVNIRDLEPEELSIINHFNIKSFSPQNIKDLGLQMVAQQTLLHLEHCDYIYLSFDVDSLDPAVSYGTGTPVPDGFKKNEAIELLRMFLVQPNLKIFEITEINPLLDRNNPMEDVAAEIIEKVMIGIMGSPDHS